MYKNDVSKARQLVVAALKSGRYKQGFGRLRRDDTFCAAGVVCDTFLVHEHGLNVIANSGFYYYNGHGGSLPGIVRKWIDYDPCELSLIGMNDGGRFSLKDIGQIFEEFWKLNQKD